MAVLSRDKPDKVVRQFKAPTDKEQLIAWANHKRDVGRPTTADAQMKLNLAFFLGYQWVTWNDQARQYVQPVNNPEDPNAPVRITSNKVAPLLERTIAKLTKDSPVPECRPVSDDDDDVGSAKVGTRILYSELDRLKWRQWLGRFLFWPGVIGHSYAHIYWDATKGAKVGRDEENERDLHEGDVCIDIVAAFEMAIDPSARDDIHQAKWAVRTTTMTREAAWDKFDVDLQGGARRSLAQEVISLGAPGIAGDPNAQSEEWVEVHQLWMVPCKAAPEGLVLTWSENQLIDRKPFPYEHGQLPFVQCNLLPGVGTREGRTWLTDILPLQVDYNDALSREATIRRQLVPMLLAPVGSVDPHRIDSRVRVVQYRDTGREPKLEMPNAAWAQQFEMGMARDDADMGERAGISDASSGRGTSGAPAAAILALQEADDTKMALSAVELTAFVARFGKQILMLCSQFWDEERTVRTWSDEDVIEAHRYMKTDIKTNLDVHIAAESALPKSKAARTQLMMELQARFPNDFDLQTVIRLLDMPGVDFLTRSQDADTKQAVRENSIMFEGGQPKVEPFHNHVIHLRVLNDFRKTREYELLDMESKARFDGHAAVHEMLVLRQLGLVPGASPGPADPMATEMADRAAAGPAGGVPQGSAFNTPMYTDPTTGRPPSGLAVASGQAPSPLEGTAIAEKAGIGQGAGQPGRVPGVPADNQAASMGN